MLVIIFFYVEVNFELFFPFLFVLHATFVLSPKSQDVYLYAVLIRNWSQCWALYCLGMFYVVLHDELSEIR